MQLIIALLILVLTVSYIVYKLRKSIKTGGGRGCSGCCDNCSIFSPDK